MSGGKPIVTYRRPGGSESPPGRPEKWETSIYRSTSGSVAEHPEPYDTGGRSVPDQPVGLAGP